MANAERLKKLPIFVFKAFFKRMDLAFSISASESNGYLRSLLMREDFGFWHTSEINERKYISKLFKTIQNTKILY